MEVSLTLLLFLGLSACTGMMVLFDDDERDEVDAVVAVGMENDEVVVPSEGLLREVLCMLIWLGVPVP